MECFEKALRLLATRPHFRAEIERKLRQRGYDDAEVEAAVGKLVGLGYLNDDRTSLAFVAARRRRRPEGPRRLRAELQRRGVAGATIDRAVTAADGEAGAFDERAAARGAAERWLRRHALREAKDRAALARHLDRRGFGGAVIAETVRACAGVAGEAGRRSDR